MFNAVIHLCWPLYCYAVKIEEGLKIEFWYHYQCKRGIKHGVHNLKRSSKRQQDSKKINNEAHHPKKLCSTIQTFNSNQSFFCQRMSEERLQDIMQDAKDPELKTTFRESPLSLEVFKIRLLVSHHAMASELKYHWKCWNKIIVNCILEVKYASAIPSSTELESHTLMPSSSAKSTSGNISFAWLFKYSQNWLWHAKILLVCFEN